MFDHFLQSSHRDDSNKWSNVGFGEKITQILSVEVCFTYFICTSDPFDVFRTSRVDLELHVLRTGKTQHHIGESIACTVNSGKVVTSLTLSLPNKLSSAIFLFCFNFQSA